ncbi:MAG: YggT family protein [Alphaproteobacteria bacterium]|nr:YggT family protein [Alphaproteobacteria bacterium]
MGGLFEPFFYIIGIVVDAYFKIVVVEVVLHWLIHFKVLEVSNKYAQKVMEFLEMATQPVYEKIRAKVPPIAGFDISPFVLMLILLFVERIVYRIGEMLL